MKKIIIINFLYVLVVFIIAMLMSCSEDSPTDPKEDEINSLSSQTITSTGGSLKTDEVEIIIPSGAFSTSQEIKILESTEDNLFGVNAKSDFFVLDGLPQEFSKPIQIKIKYTGDLTDSTFIAIGEHNFITSLNEKTTTYQLISAKDSAGYLIGSLPPLYSETIGKTTSNNSDNASKLSISFGAIAGLVSYVSSQEHFKITFPSSVLTQTYDLAKYLEAAYSKIESMGFSYSRRTKWPVNVTVKVLKNDIYGDQTNSIWGNNYGYLRFNFDKMDEAEEMKVTAGHEFFHLVQSFYDPRSAWSKAGSPMPNYWLDEAASVWAEEFFSSSSGYVSPNFEYNVVDILKGAKTGNAKDESQNYGYGMSSFLKYLTKTEGNSKIVDVYNNISAGQAPFRAISELLPINVGFSWHSYLKSLFTFDLYKGNIFKPATLSATAGTKQKFTIKAASDSVKIFKSSLSDISATIFTVDNRFEDMSGNAFLEFTCEDWKFQLYKVNSSSSVLLESGKDSLNVLDYKKFTDDGYKIIAVLYNDDYNSPYTNKRDYEFKIRVVNPIEFNFIDFRIQTEGTFTSKRKEGVKDSVWTYNSGTSISQLDFNDPQVIAINGNYVNCSVQWIHPDGWVYNYQLNLVFNDINNPTSINSFDCQWSQTYNDGASVTSHNKSASGTNIPLEAAFGELNFRITGNITNNLSEYSDDFEGYYGIYNPPISSERRLNSFETSDGRIEFSLVTR